MAKSYYSGLDGELQMKFAGGWQTMAKVKNWSFSSTMTVLETTSLGDTDRTLVDGVRSLSGSCSLYYYSDDSSLDNVAGADDFLRKMLKPYKPLVSTEDPPSGTDLGVTKRSSKVTLKFLVKQDRSGFAGPGEGVPGGDKYLWIQAWITNITMSMAVGEVLSADITFEADGAPIEDTYTNHALPD